MRHVADLSLQVIKNAGETLHWSEPISITAGRGGRDTNTLIVRLDALTCISVQCGCLTIHCTDWFCANHVAEAIMPSGPA